MVAASASVANALPARSASVVLPSIVQAARKQALAPGAPLIRPGMSQRLVCDGLSLTTALSAGPWPAVGAPRAGPSKSGVRGTSGLTLSGNAEPELAATELTAPELATTVGTHCKVELVEVEVEEV